MDLFKPVSQREFGRMVGQSEGAVRKAVKRGSILKGVNENKKIIPAIASEEWGKLFVDDLIEGTAGQDEQAATPGDQQPDPVEPPESSLNDPTELKFNLADYSVTDTSAGEGSGVSDEDLLKGISETTPKAEADRIKAVYQARKARLDWLETQGNLVDKGLVYQNLFAFGAVLRDNFLNIPDRVVANIRAADTTNEGIKMLAHEIEGVLKSLVGLGDIKLTKDEK